MSMQLRDLQQAVDWAAVDAAHGALTAAGRVLDEAKGAALHRAVDGLAFVRRELGDDIKGWLPADCAVQVQGLLYLFLDERGAQLGAPPNRLRRVFRPQALATGGLPFLQPIGGALPPSLAKVLG